MQLRSRGNKNKPNNANLPLRRSSRNKNKISQRPPRPPRQPPPQQPTIATNTCPFDGLLTYCNISENSIQQLERKVPILGMKLRGVRHIQKNDTQQYASRRLFQRIVAELIDHLKSSCNINSRIVSSECGLWVLAPGTDRLKSFKEGPHHRDTEMQCSGYLTAIILLGDRADPKYGGVTIYRDSQQIKPTLLQFKENAKKFLQTRIKNGEVTAEVVKREEFNCFIFDSRLIHFSHVHTHHKQRTAFVIQLRWEDAVEVSDQKHELDDITVGNVSY